MKICEVLCGTVFDFLPFVLKVFLISMELPKPKRRRAESAQERRARLDINNERARAKRRAETEEQNKERLEKRNAGDRARRSAEKPIEKQSRLSRRWQMNLLLKEQ